MADPHAQRLSTNPDVWLLNLKPPYQFRSPFDGKPFVLVLHSDEKRFAAAARSKLCDQIVASGCRYVCCSGIGCELVHDAVDEAIVKAGLEHDRPGSDIIMTTWHKDESFSEVIWFAMNSTSFSFDTVIVERVAIVLLNADGDRIAEATAAAIG